MEAEKQSIFIQLDGNLYRSDHLDPCVLYFTLFDVPNRSAKIQSGSGLDPEGRQRASAGPNIHRKKNTSPSDTKKQEDQQDQLLKKVNTYIKDNHLKAQMTAKRDERGVVLVLQEAVLFDTGEAKVLKNAETLLHQIAVLLQTIPNDIQVEGHTDSRNISTYRYPSNWELSAARASGVIQYFTSKEKLPSKRFIAVGYADTKPVKDNKTNEHMKENRRVEIVIKNQKRPLRKGRFLLCSLLFRTYRI